MWGIKWVHLSLPLVTEYKRDWATRPAGGSSFRPFDSNSTKIAAEGHERWLGAMSQRIVRDASLLLAIIYTSAQRTLV
jgi:hypothetical protein